MSPQHNREAPDPIEPRRCLHPTMSPQPLERVAAAEAERVFRKELIADEIACRPALARNHRRRVIGDLYVHAWPPRLTPRHA